MPKKKSVRLRVRAAIGDTVHRAAARAKAVVENGANSQKEPRDFVQHKTSGKDPVALWDHRWNRKRKLLPNLRLTYPSDEELFEIAQLAEVTDASSFAQHMCSIILDAHLNDASYRTLNISEVKKALDRVVKQAKQLGLALSELDVGRGSKGSSNYAGVLIELELSKNVGEMVLLPEYIDLLGVLSTATERAGQKRIHPPKGAGGNSAFDVLISKLEMAARMRRGSWRNYRDKDVTWRGTLLPALGILKNYLPPNFFPMGELGRSVDHIRNRLKHHILKNSPTTK